MDCKTCKEKDRHVQHEPVPWLTYEAEQIRADKRDRRQLVIICILIGLLLASVVAFYFVHHKDMSRIEAIDKNAMEKIEQNNKEWLEYINSFDFMDYEYSQDGQGVNIIGDRNGVDYNVSEAESEDPDAEEP